MIKYQIFIEYVGTDFRGWQIQKKGKTIQGIIQNTISKILKEKIILFGSGRTDAGVHAIEQSAHFSSEKQIINLNKFLNSVNFFLNKYNISIIDIKKKGINFHARFNAKMRIYKYVIFNRSSAPVLNKNRVWHVIKKLDLNLMKKGARKLVGKKDFSTYRSSSCRAKSPIKTMRSVKIKSLDSEIIIEFKSQSFLQQQVRSMVGCLKYLGEKKWTLKKFTYVLESKDRSLCAPPAPPNGLFLSKIIY